ncbi:MAG: hypothetical protein WB762_26215 [Candidatus Sulfotelmatobacter sp.]
MEKIVISPAEVAETQSPAEQPARLQPKLAPAIPRWAKWILAPLVLILPLLCLVAIVLRVAMRGLPPRTRHEWTSLLATLLIVSGIVTSVATVLVFSFAPLPPVAGVGLSELDCQPIRFQELRLIAMIFAPTDGMKGSASIPTTKVLISTTDS